MIPTQQQFEWLTTPRGGKARGSTLLRIDSALTNWEKAQSDAPKGQLQALYLLIKECGHYLKKHGPLGVSNGQMGGHRKRSMRAQQVESLLAETQSELRRVAPTVGRALRIVELQKRRQKEKLNGGQQPLKGLYPGFHHERNMWVDGKKQTMPFSGSQIMNVGGDIYYSDWGRSQEGVEAFKHIHDITLDQYKVMGELGGGLKVKYHNKISRLEFLAVPDGNGGFADIDERPINMTIKQGLLAVLHMYALDHHGNLFTRESPPRNFTEFFNHSSFNAGREIMCAGMIWIRNGKLKHLDNESGHYKPSWENLVQAVRFLHEEGTDVSGARIGGYGRESFKAASVLDGTLQEFTKMEEEDFEMDNGLRPPPVWRPGVRIGRQRT
jgi:hypothetical protein